MTLPVDKKYRLNIWLRQPARKIRMADVTESELSDLLNVMAMKGWTEVHGQNNAGSVVIIPASNVAYVEAVEK